jgi:hypothetical protein
MLWLTSYPKRIAILRSIAKMDLNSNPAWGAPRATIGVKPSPCILPRITEHESQVTAEVAFSPGSPNNELVAEVVKT